MEIFVWLQAFPSKYTQDLVLFENYRLHPEEFPKRTQLSQLCSDLLKIYYFLCRFTNQRGFNMNFSHQLYYKTKSDLMSI